ncbi:hypothetical protein ZOSMA_44G01170 [Zostera marina]|uniref:Synechocystis YCF37 n=1 Tax=Zostera marina TaxID=29655 RepID=A0A0K9P3C2_ZOSMR|nr:hypothetical protein ZOSMA_44G01170 [Zostera marina]
MAYSLLHLLPSTVTPTVTTLPRRATLISCIADGDRSPSRSTVALFPKWSRRESLSLLLLSSAAVSLPARAENIPLFGFRKKLKNIEKEAEEIVKEGEQAVEKGIVKAEKTVVEGIMTTEEEIIAAEAKVQSGLIQAGAVAAAEALSVIVGVSVVNGILRTDS